jgi:hypothetical protein
VELKSETDQSERDRVITFLYYAALAVLFPVVIWHWIFGGRYGLFGTVAVWSVCALILLGFLNAIGLFGRR